jgi:hypothetical protein
MRCAKRVARARSRHVIATKNSEMTDDEDSHGEKPR